MQRAQEPSYLRPSKRGQKVVEGGGEGRVLLVDSRCLVRALSTDNIGESREHNI